MLATPGMDALPLIRTENLVKHFRLRRGLRAPALVRAVDGISFSIREGTTLALVGESGCGKSTLGRTLVRLWKPTAGAVYMGQTCVTALGRAELRAFRRQMQIIFQDPYASLPPRMKVRQILLEPLDVHHLAQKRPQKMQRVSELLEQVGLRAEIAQRYPHELSGGQRQRVALARALAVEPRFVVADEPLSALDVSVQAQIVNLLADLQVRHRLTYLFVSHDLGLMEHLANDIAVMYLGTLVEIAPAKVLYEAPRHPYTQALLSAIPSIDPARRRKRILLEGEMPSPIAVPSGCRFHPRCPLAQDPRRRARCQSEVPLLRPVGKPEQLVACHFAEES